MSGTSVLATLEERADHEAGHFFVARALDLKFHPYWLTVELREGSGGSCGIGWYEHPTLEAYAQYMVGGLTAQLYGLQFRERVRRGREGTLAVDDALRAAFEEYIGRAVAGGHTDLVQLYQHTEIASLEWGPVLVKTLDLIASAWDKVSFLSEELQKERTFFGAEPHVLLHAHETDNIQMSMAVTWYRKFRQVAEPPPAWTGGAGPDTPAGPWYENFHEWFAREGQKPDETMDAWYNRLHGIEDDEAEEDEEEDAQADE